MANDGVLSPGERYRVVDLCVNQGDHYNFDNFGVNKNKYKVAGVMYKVQGGLQPKIKDTAVKRTHDTIKAINDKNGPTIGFGVYIYCAWHLTVDSYTKKYYNAGNYSKNVSTFKNMPIGSIMNNIISQMNLTTYTARALQEAMSLVNTLRANNINTSVIGIDIEVGSKESFASDLQDLGVNSGRFKKAMTDTVNAYCSYLKAYGYTPVLYCSASPLYFDWYNYKNLNCKLWVALHSDNHYSTWDAANGADSERPVSEKESSKYFAKMAESINDDKMFMWQHSGDAAPKDQASLKANSFGGVFKSGKNTIGADVNWCYIDLFGIAGGSASSAGGNDAYTEFSGEQRVKVEPEIKWFDKPYLLENGAVTGDKCYISTLPGPSNEKSFMRKKNKVMSGINFFIPVYGYVKTFYIYSESTSPIPIYNLIIRPYPDEFMVVYNSDVTKDIIDKIVSGSKSLTVDGRNIYIRKMVNEPSATKPPRNFGSVTKMTELADKLNQFEINNLYNGSNTNDRIDVYEKRDTTTKLDIYFPMGPELMDSVKTTTLSSLYIYGSITIKGVIYYGVLSGTDGNSGFNSESNAHIAPEFVFVKKSELEKCYLRCNVKKVTEYIEYYPHEPINVGHPYYLMTDNGDITVKSTSLSPNISSKYDVNNFKTFLTMKGVRGLWTGIYPVLGKTIYEAEKDNEKYFCIPNPYFPPEKMELSDTIILSNVITYGLAAPVRNIWIRQDNAYNYEYKDHDESLETLSTGVVQDGNNNFRSRYPGKQSPFGGTYQPGTTLYIYQYSLDKKYIRVTPYNASTQHWLTSLGTDTSSIAKYGLDYTNAADYLTRVSEDFNELETYSVLLSKLKSTMSATKTNFALNSRDVTTNEEYSKMMNQKITEQGFINACRVFGSHPQFTPYADIKVDEYDVGRMFYESHVFEQCIVSITPGEAEYMPFLSNTATNNFTELIASKAASNESISSSELQDAIGNKGGSFFKFKSAWAKYCNYVNVLCRAMAIYLGIGDVCFPGTDIKYKYFDWGEYNKMTPASTDTSAFGSFTSSIAQDVIGTNSYVHFSAVSQPSESMGISTRSSSIEGLLDGTLTDWIKDFTFMTNGVAGSEAIGKISENVTEVLSGIGGGSDLIKGLAEKGSAYLSGSRIVFPQLLDDVSYDKSFNCTCKFISPSGDTESIYLRTLVPLAHLLAFVLPKQVDSDMYTYPFIIRASCPGVFSTDLGVISSLSISRGGSDETAWTYNGLPSEIEVSFSVTPLYTKLMMSSSTKPFQYLTNNGLHEYLATLCAVDVKKPQTDIQLETFTAMLVGGVADIPTNIYRGIMDSKMINHLRDRLRII